MISKFNIKVETSVLGASCRILCPKCPSPNWSSVSSYFTKNGIRFNLHNFARHYHLHAERLVRASGGTSATDIDGVLNELRSLKDEVAKRNDSQIRACTSTDNTQEKIEDLKDMIEILKTELEKKDSKMQELQEHLEKMSISNTLGKYLISFFF